MSKGLEALDKIETLLFTNVNILKLNDYKNELDIIKKALKDFESIQNIQFVVVDKKISDEDIERLKNQRALGVGAEETKIESLVDEETQKKLEALEIIKKSGLSFEHLLTIKREENYEEYSKSIESDYEPFKFELKKSEQEYNLLKEVLL